MAPKKAIPAIRSAAALPITYVLFWNRSKGSIGSAALFSTRMKAATPITASANSPMTCKDPHGYSCPPRLSARRSGTTATRSVTDPHQSMLTLRSSFGFSAGIWKMMNASAIRPTGRFT